MTRMSSSAIKLLFAALVLISLISRCPDARAGTLHFTSGADWYSLALPPGELPPLDSHGLTWTDPNYDDSHWVPATAPYPDAVTTPSEIIAGTSAQLMWNCNSGCSPLNGTNGPVQTFYRLDLTLPKYQPFPAFPYFVTGASISIIADDYFELYINGTQKTSARLDDHQNALGQPVPLTGVFLNLLQEGDATQAAKNVIAIRACDGFSSPLANDSTDCHDRQNEYVFVDGSITLLGDYLPTVRSAVPEPSSGLLLAVGLAGIVGWSLIRTCLLSRV
jgi:hypothetical protein